MFDLPYTWFFPLVGLGAWAADNRRVLRHLKYGINGEYQEAIRAGEGQAVTFFNRHLEQVEM